MSKTGCRADSSPSGLPAGRRVSYCPLFSKGLGGFHIDDRPLSTRLISTILQPFILCLSPDSLTSKDEVRSSSGWANPFYIKDLSRPAVFASLETRPVVRKSTRIFEPKARDLLLPRLMNGEIAV